MSSSISSSEQGGVFRRARRIASPWRSWLAILVTVVFGGTALVLAGVVLLDPFATGRLTPFTHFSVTTDKRILSHAGRVRNPAFDSAIIGNSRAFGLEPARLSQGTGRHFVHLALEAAFHDDQLEMLSLFARHHAGRAPLILQVVDAENWCNAVRGKTGYQMPWWLYDGPNASYLQRILTAESVAAALRRVGIALGLANDVVRRDGYALWLPKDTPQLRLAMTLAPSPANAIPADAPFVELDDLAQALGRLEPASRVVLFMPPMFARALPVAGSLAEARLIACKARLRAIAGARPNTVFVDARRDTPAVRDPSNFIDATHYLDAVAMPAEADLSAAIKGMAN